MIGLVHPPDGFRHQIQTQRYLHAIPAPHIQAILCNKTVAHMSGKKGMGFRTVTLIVSGVVSETSGGALKVNSSSQICKIYLIEHMLDALNTQS